MRKRLIINLFLMAVIAGFGLNSAVFASASEPQPVALGLAVDFQSFVDPNYLIVDIIVEPGLIPVNSLAIDLEFPAAKLTLASTDFDQSFCSLVPFKRIDNLAGNYRLICGSPAAITGSDTQVITRLKFIKLQPGWAKLAFGDDTQALAADGQGTALPILTEINRINLIK